MLQLGPVALHGNVVWRQWFEAAVGTTAEGFFVDEISIPSPAPTATRWMPAAAWS